MPEFDYFLKYQVEARHLEFSTWTPPPKGRFGGSGHLLGRFRSNYGSTVLEGSYKHKTALGLRF
jgi:hypothetical protein